MLLSARVVNLGLAVTVCMLPFRLKKRLDRAKTSELAEGGCVEKTTVRLPPRLCRKGLVSMVFNLAFAPETCGCDATPPGGFHKGSVLG